MLLLSPLCLEPTPMPPLEAALTLCQSTALSCVCPPRLVLPHVLPEHPSFTCTWRSTLPQILGACSGPTPAPPAYVWDELCHGSDSLALRELSPLGP